MRLTTRGRYAVTAMLDLSYHGAGKPISLAEISHRQDISLSYLEQLFAKLRRCGLVRSVRGPGGGYVLGEKPEEISIAAIIRAVDEPIRATSCTGEAEKVCRPGSSNPNNPSRCITHHLWENVGEHLNRYLESLDLAHLQADMLASALRGDA
ncbi:Rrf2 family transcriptional regulator [Candidatus Magnetaquicoccus inordinatus]|uniref:Rrf2 family transcriptional regulator n=1 Tax=Candidatus Magnetaquicoccus inordinatus TaxID=2496818 RepID=UPI00102B64CA|nr:Rrf2 family transcriptional regulator [Candidatus Magnetaquicoccus inordinatus]